MTSQFIRLLTKKSFLPLFVTQFFGAFNDNAYKLAMLTLISFHLSQSQAHSEYYQAMAGALFILPFFICSATSGQLVDKYDKAVLTRLVKFFELILMIFGGFAFYLGSITLLMVTLTGMGVHSAFFGPIKYAILPDHVPQEDLLTATGLIEASTFLAILLGTTLGTLAIGEHHSPPLIAIMLTISAAIIGFVSSLYIPKAPSLATKVLVDFNVLRASMHIISQSRKDRGTFLAIMTISWFWLIGAVTLTKLPDYVHYVLGAKTTVFAFFLALFSIGIGVGSLLISSILRGKITLSVVPGALLILSLFTFDLYLASPISANESLLGLDFFFNDIRHWRISVDLFMIAVSSGLFIVPLYTYLQIHCPAERRARTIAANNIYNSLFMILGSLLVMVLLKLEASIPEVFLMLGLLNILAAFFVWKGLMRLKREV